MNPAHVDPDNRPQHAPESTNAGPADPNPVQDAPREKGATRIAGFPRQRASGKREFSPWRAIRRKCLDCCGGSTKAVRYCPMDGVHSTPCPLWPGRFGCKPETARRRHGAWLLDPEAMPDANMNLEDLR